MKLDQRLIVPIVDSRTARSIVRATIAIGKALGIRVTAEGVETDRHASLLEELGCDTLQGFHFARPMDIEDLGQHLGAHPGDAGAAAARGA
jgi:EAL domain-containing protein (putative c-di-GMP-specific phosphodiesterase class I)